MLADFRYAFRSLRRTPLFTAVALVSLGLGIGANSAVFSVADQILLRRLPVDHAAELLVLQSPGPNSGRVFGDNLFSHPMYVDLRDHNESFTGLAARYLAPLNLTYRNRSEQVQAEIVSGNYFATLGLRMFLGRGIAADDDRVPGAHSVVVATYDFWKNRLGANRAIVNQVLLLNGHPMVVIGVTAPGYRGFDIGSRTDVLVPTMMKAQMTPTWNGLDERRVLWLQLIGRLKPGVEPAQARALLEPYYRALLAMELPGTSFRSEGQRHDFVSKPLLLTPAARGVSDFRDQATAPVVILMAIVGLLLLIACANVANLLLARAVGRQREIAIRLAVGASRFRLVRQLVAESVTLSLAGAGLGLLFASWTAGAMVALMGSSQDLGIVPDLDWRVFAFAFALALATGILFGLVPAWQGTSPSVAATLKDLAGSVSAAAGQVRTRKVLVVAQVALSLVMLSAAVMFARSLGNLNRVDLGFRRDGLLEFSVDPSLNGYSAERIRQFAANLTRRVASLPRVQSAAVGVNAVISWNSDRSTVQVAGYQPKDDEDMSPNVDEVGPGYFATMGIPLLAGREFGEWDRRGAPRVAVVNDVFARYFFGNGNPIGRQFAFTSARGRPIEIVGVVRGSKYASVDEKIPRVIYTPFAQEDNPGSLVMYVRTSGDPRRLTGAMRREVSALDAELPVTNLRTMDEQVREALSGQRMMAALSTTFAALATLLAAIGLYGVMAYTVTRRTREIGIRLALGAGRVSLVGMVLREVAVLTATGLAIALPLARLLARLATGQLYGIAPGDPASLLLAAIVLVAVALIAGYIPAERATRVNPLRALRYE